MKKNPNLKVPDSKLCFAFYVLSSELYFPEGAWGKFKTGGENDFRTAFISDI